MDQDVGTNTKDGTLLENQILEYLSQKTEPYTCVKFIFAWLKEKSLLKPNESKKRMNQALNSLTKRKMIAGKIVNNVAMYKLLAHEPSKQASPIHSPPPKGQNSYIPMGYIMDDLMPDTFVPNHLVEQCTKLWLDHFKTQLTSGMGRDRTTSKIKFQVHTQSYRDYLEENHTDTMVSKAFSRACRAMEEIGWTCHVASTSPITITFSI